MPGNPKKPTITALNFVIGKVVPRLLPKKLKKSNNKQYLLLLWILYFFSKLPHMYVVEDGNIDDAAFGQ